MSLSHLERNYVVYLRIENFYVVVLACSQMDDSCDVSCGILTIFSEGWSIGSTGGRLKSVISSAPEIEL